ncbi:ABC transporter ATP-binding protein [Methyloligella sp. 2.7D]|uniref:metal ABC transporter ATP-binding protein n=1 Tax=unclassified Methyloligella TaxID=2625955 RepID=UPI00157DC98B|nr:ABC transporter ATP-binding protein [Methyloligella sp. GL2]QKP76448.1 ABC transporter ATP-binding protein [Methyloligella sp. GL2]
MSGTKPSLVAFDDLTLGYDGVPVLSGVSGTIAEGDLLALIGPNGAGKSTLLKAMMGEIKPLSGAVRLLGLKPSDIAYLPQRSDIDPSFPMSVFDCVAMGLWREIGVFGGVGRAGREKVMAALETVGLAAFARSPIGSLSGGQLQRSLFARLLLQDAPLILLDEPFRAIDAETVENLLTLIERWHGEGRTIVAALHDTRRVRAHFPKTLIVAREVVAWGPTKEVLTPANLGRSDQERAAWEGPAAHAAEARLPA